MMKVKPTDLGMAVDRRIDVRNLDEYVSERLPDCECVPLDRLLSVASSWDPDQRVLLVCRTGQRSQQAAADLAKCGFREVHVVEGGLDACRSAGVKLIQERRRLPIHRQVFVGAGLVLLAGLGLSLVQPWFMGLVWFVSAMLVIAGVTGFCPMAYILARLPWNRVAAESSAGKSASCCAG